MIPIPCYIKFKRKERQHSILVLKGGIEHRSAIGVMFDFPV